MTIEKFDILKPYKSETVKNKKEIKKKKESQDKKDQKNITTKIKNDIPKNKMKKTKANKIKEEKNINISFSLFIE